MFELLLNDGFTPGAEMVESVQDLNFILGIQTTVQPWSLYKVVAHYRFLLISANIYLSSLGWLENTRMSTKPKYMLGCPIDPAYYFELQQSLI